MEEVKPYVVIVIVIVFGAHLFSSLPRSRGVDSPSKYTR
jgi:hypothetical protein